MATSRFLSQDSFQVGLRHSALSGGLLVLACGLTLGSIQIFGQAGHIGPQVAVDIPKYVPPPPKAIEAAPGAATPAEADPGNVRPGATGWFPWRLPDGAMTPWMPGTPPPAAAQPSAADPAVNAVAAPDPKVTSVAEAAAAEPMPPVAGTARIMAPQMGGAGAEPAGVRVYRGPRAAALTAAPAAGVHEAGSGGMLPAIGPGGRTVFDVYKKPFSANGRPKVALVVGGLGLNARVTQRAIDELPAEVTLSFVPYADNLQGWINKARAAGHEVILEIPMEPFDYPDNDPGPHTLLSTAPADENVRRLEFLLARASGYFAVSNYLGGKFAASGDAAGAAMRALKARGVGFVSDGSAAPLDSAARAAGLRSAEADRAIDQRPSGEDIAAQLGALEAQAGQRGEALGFGVAYSVTIDQIARWARDAERRGIQLAPASSLAS